MDACLFTTEDSKKVLELVAVLRVQLAEVEAAAAKVGPSKERLAALAKKKAEAQAKALRAKVQRLFKKPASKPSKSRTTSRRASIVAEQSPQESGGESASVDRYLWKGPSRKKVRAHLKAAEIDLTDVDIGEAKDGGPRKVSCASLTVADRFCSQVAKSRKLASLIPGVKTTHRPLSCAQRKQAKRAAWQKARAQTPAKPGTSARGPQSTTEPERKSAGICFQFQQYGDCRRTACKFKHVRQGPPPASPPPAQLQHQHQPPQQTQQLQLHHVPKSSDICKQFQHRGFCDYGKACRFTHATSPAPATPPTASTQPPTSQAKTSWTGGVCWRWRQTGGCYYGPRCHNVQDHTPTPAQH